MTPKFVRAFFLDMTIQNTQNFTLISNLRKEWKKVHPEKVICQNLLQISIEEENPQFCTLFLHVTFLLAKFLHFSQQFRKQRKILHFFIPIFKFGEYKVFRSYKHFFKALKPNSQETAQNFEKGVLHSFLEFLFIHMYQWTRLTF